MMDVYFLSVLLSAIAVSLSVFPFAIRLLRYYKVGQYIQDDGPKHASKSQTPTCAGVVIILLMNLVVIVFGGFRTWETLIVDMVLVGYMLVGLVDDLSKLFNKDNNLGLSPRMKLLLQTVIAIIAIACLQSISLSKLTYLTFPMGQGTFFAIDLGWFYYPFAIFAILGATNAFNLTDGLDGLAGGLVILVLSGLFMMLSLALYPDLSALLRRDLALLLITLIGILIGFLCFNSYPATVFLGDSGSLSLGAGLVTVAIIMKMEIVFALMCGVFIIETISVIAQVLYFRRSGGKRLFKMAPLHHHFELCGYKEPKIVFRFWILGLIFLLMSICLLV